MTSSCSKAPGTWSSLTYNRYLSMVPRVTTISFSGDDRDTQEGHWHCPLAAAADAESRFLVQWVQKGATAKKRRSETQTHRGLMSWPLSPMNGSPSLKTLRLPDTAGFCPPEPQLLRSAPYRTPWHPPIMLRHVRLFATPWIVASQAPRSMGFSRQEYLEWSAISSSRGSSNPGIEP